MDDTKESMSYKHEYDTYMKLQRLIQFEQRPAKFNPNGVPILGKETDTNFYS